MLSGITDDQSAEQGQFNINGLEIDLAELDAFECKLKEKRSQLPQKSDSANDDESAQVDYLDEYLQRLQLTTAAREEEESRCNGGEVTRIGDPAVAGGGDQQEMEPKPVLKRYSFLQLLLMFMSIMSIAKLLNQRYGN